MREKVTFEERVEVKLDRSEGKPVDSKTGQTEYMRVVDNDRRIMFCPPALELAIKECGAAEGDIVRIDRIKAGRTFTWDVAILGPGGQTTRTYQPEEERRPHSPRHERFEERRPAAAAPTGIDRDTELMTAAFMSAIVSANEAEMFAARKQLRDFRLSAADIKNMAITIYIQRSRGGHA